MPGDFGAVAAASHTAPFAFPGAGSVLEHPPALRVLTDPQARRLALDQLTRDRFGKPGDGAIHGVSLVTMVERDPVGCGDQLVGVMRSKGTVDLVQVGGLLRLVP